MHVRSCLKERGMEIQVWDRDPKNLQMMKLVVDIARFLQIPVIAEGVERAAHLRQLREIGCAMVQGYYFSKPVPAEEFEKFIKKEERKKCSQ